LRQTARHREGANIDESADLMRLQRTRQLVERPRRVSDGVERSQRRFDAAQDLCDALERCCNECILLGSDRAQVEQNPAIFDARDDRRIGVA
jgi:hypothetical protein